MKLTKREIRLIAEIEKNKSRRLWGAGIGFVIVLVAWFTASHLEWLSDSSSTVIGICLGVAIANLTYAFSTVRVDDKLNDILQRYVNNDPEALRQLSSVQSGSASEEPAQSV